MAECGATIRYPGQPKFTCTLPAGHKAPAGNKAPHFNAELGRLVRLVNRGRTDPKDATMAEPDPYEYRILRIPRGQDIDGAVAELHVSEGGSIVTMDIRVPARQATTMLTIDGVLSAADQDRIREAASKSVAAGCTCAWTYSTTGDPISRAGDVISRSPRGNCPVHGDEDRIRDAMAEAHDHPGRTITR